MELKIGFESLSGRQVRIQRQQESGSHNKAINFNVNEADEENKLPPLSIYKPKTR